MASTVMQPQRVELATAKKVRQGSKRRTVAELSHLERRIIPDEYEGRGPGSCGKIAEELGVQLSAVHSVLIHKCYREIRRINATLVMRGAASEQRKGIQREHGLEIVKGKIA